MKGLKQCLLFPKFNCGCGLLTLALALAWRAHGADPVLIGQWPGWQRGPAYSVAVSGNYAYVADQEAGLQVIDVSNPTNCLQVGGYGSSGQAWGVAVSGNYAYVADGAAGLQVIDVSDPANPRRVGCYDISGTAYGLVVSGNHAYVADGSWGLLIFELTPTPRLRITSITRAAGTATVCYTNTIPGTNYTLEYRTNLTTGSWQPVGTQPAPGYSASQTDTSAGPAQRYYRVFYLP